MTTTQLAEAAAVSLQNGLSDQFTPLTRKDLADYWYGALVAAGFNAPRHDYLRLLAFAEQAAGMRKAQAA
jgi:hypothetical protein